MPEVTIDISKGQPVSDSTARFRNLGRFPNLGEGLVRAADALGDITQERVNKTRANTLFTQTRRAIQEFVHDPQIQQAHPDPLERQQFFLNGIETIRDRALLEAETQGVREYFDDKLRTFIGQTQDKVFKDSVQQLQGRAKELTAEGLDNYTHNVSEIFREDPENLDISSKLTRFPTTSDSKEEEEVAVVTIQGVDTAVMDILVEAEHLQETLTDVLEDLPEDEQRKVLQDYRPKLIKELVTIAIRQNPEAFIDNDVRKLHVMFPTIDANGRLAWDQVHEFTPTEAVNFRNQAIEEFKKIEDHNNRVEQRDEKIQKEKAETFKATILIPGLNSENPDHASLEAQVREQVRNGEFSLNVANPMLESIAKDKVGQRKTFITRNAYTELYVGIKTGTKDANDVLSAYAREVNGITDEQKNDLLRLIDTRKTQGKTEIDGIVTETEEFLQGFLKVKGPLANILGSAEQALPTVMYRVLGALEAVPVNELTPDRAREIALSEVARGLPSLLKKLVETDLSEDATGGSLRVEQLRPLLQGVSWSEQGFKKTIRQKLANKEMSQRQAVVAIFAQKVTAGIKGLQQEKDIMAPALAEGLRAPITVVQEREKAEVKASEAVVQQAEVNIQEAIASFKKTQQETKTFFKEFSTTQPTPSPKEEVAVPPRPKRPDDIVIPKLKEFRGGEFTKQLSSRSPLASEVEQEWKKFREGEQQINVDPTKRPKTETKIGVAQEQDIPSFLEGESYQDFRWTEIEKEKARLVSEGAEPDAPFGRRTDGTPKGAGYFGLLKMLDGRHDVASEISIGLNIDGKEIEVPSLVPTLTRKQVLRLLEGKPVTEAIMKKAKAHAMKRMKAGKSPFAQDGENVLLVHPKLVYGPYHPVIPRKGKE